MTLPAIVLSLIATTANVAGAPDNIRIDVLRWSTDAERDRLVSAWSPAAKPAPPAPAPGRGGRGGRGGVSEPAPALTPEASLTNALKEAPTVGYLWSSEVAGYPIRYAARVPGPAGSQRIILITSKRLGATNDLWKPSAGEPAPYNFSVLELRLNEKQEGEGKISLIGKIAPDPSAKVVTLADYGALPVTLKNIQEKKDIQEKAPQKP